MSVHVAMLESLRWKVTESMPESASEAVAPSAIVSRFGEPIGLSATVGASVSTLTIAPPALYVAVFPTASVTT